MKNIFITLAALTIAIPAFSQDKPDVYLQTDLTSAYLWRGSQSAGVSIQPQVGLKWKGLHLYFWGNVQLSPPDNEPEKHEIDVFLKYNITTALTVGLKNVYVNTRGDGFLRYGAIQDASNGLDALISYNFKYFSLEWSTTIAGYDGYDHHGHRAYGSYLSIDVPFHFAFFDWNANVGIVPYYCSRYDEDVSKGFHVNQCALKMSHSFDFNRSKISLTPYAMGMVNPSSRKAYFQIGVRFLFDP